MLPVWLVQRKQWVADFGQKVRLIPIFNEYEFCDIEIRYILKSIVIIWSKGMWHSVLCLPDNDSHYYKAVKHNILCTWTVHNPPTDKVFRHVAMC